MHKEKEYDFSKAKRVSEVPILARHQAEELVGKERITIRIDADILAWFRTQVRGGGNYQTLINAALREHMERQQGTSLEETLRRVVREELRAAG
jgi:uncharacterized protein (DUF4415 family)